MAVLWLGTLGTPLALAVASACPGRAGRLAAALGPWAALPAVVAALVPAGDAGREYPLMLLGARIGLDAIGRVFLLLTGLLWLLAALFARAYLARDARRAGFDVCFLLAMAGNLGLVVAQDAVTFYAGFALMTFAAYGLVVHERTPGARRAGRVYIVMAVFGELLILAGLLLAVSGVGTGELARLSAGLTVAPARDLVLALLLAGFGVKVGILPLHVWLPLAHPVAPTPASAVLSGAMIKAGLLAWLRFLPLGETAFAGWGATVVLVGVAGAFAGVALGMTQSDPKTLLAYSSISQMGLSTTAVGIGLLRAEAWPVALGACLAQALHHGLVKGALFLGVGVIQAAGGDAGRRRLALAGLGLAALSLAGAPLTGGAAAKAMLKEAAALGPGAWAPGLGHLLPLTAAGTTMLMGRFLLLVGRDAGRAADHAWHPGLWAPWTVLLGAGAVTAWTWPSWYGVEALAAKALTPSGIWGGLWPVVAGAAALWIGQALAPPRGTRWRIEAGDVIVVFAAVARWLAALPGRPGWPGRARPVPGLVTMAGRVRAKTSRAALAMACVEGAIARWRVAGVLVLSLLGALVATFFLG